MFVDGGAEDTKIVFDGNAQDFHIGLDDTDDDLKIGIGSAVGTTSAIVIDENGHVTKPLQSAFSVTVSGGVRRRSSTVGGLTRLTFNSERFDLNGGLVLANGENEFTAPVTGKYLLSINIAKFKVWIHGATNYNIEITTSNRRYIKFACVEDYISQMLNHGYSMTMGHMDG